MKINFLHLIFLTSLSLLFIKCNKRISTPNSYKKDSITKEKEVVIERNYSFLTDTINRAKSFDSLYTFHKDIRLYPEMISNHPFGEILWNESAQVFITRAKFSLLSKDLKLIYEDTWNLAHRVFSYQHLPIAVGTNDIRLNFYDLINKKIINQYPILGTVKNLYELEDNQLSVLTQVDDKTLYQYIFKATNWIKTDTFHIANEYRGIPFAIDPNQENFLVGNANEIQLIPTLPNSKKETKSINLESYSRPIFSKDGKRLILYSKGFNMKEESQIKIFSYPELEQIGHFYFKSDLIVSVKDNVLLAGDDDGNIKLINLKAGKVIYSNKEKDNIFSISILNETKILVGTRRKKNLTLKIVDTKSKEISASIITNTDYIVPQAISNDSKYFYFFEGGKISKLNFETFEITTVKKISSISQASFNKDGTLMAFRGPKWSTNILDLENGQLDTYERTDANFFFGGQLNELIFFFRDSTKSYNVKTKEWSPNWDTIISPRIGSIVQPNIHRNPLNSEEIIFPGRINSSKALLYINEKKFAVNQTRPIKKQRQELNFIGVDQYGNLYMADSYNEKNKNHNLYSYDAFTNELKDSIQGQFHTFYSRVASAPNRDAVYSFQNNRSFLFSPHTSTTFQFLEPLDFYWFSPDLEYFIQTKGDLIRIYKWNEKH